MEDAPRFPPRSLGKRVRALAAAGCLALAALGGAGTAHAALPGTVPDVSWGISSREIDRTVSEMKRAGVRWARLNVSWSSLEEKGKGKINQGYLSDIDQAVAKTRAAGIKALLSMADSVPYWASADPQKRVVGGRREWNPLYRPADFRDYADAFRFLVARYSRRGVRHFEVWNEPNHEYFWPSGPNPAEYAQMLKRAYQAAKAANPKAVVVAGALAQNDHRFLAGVYAAGAGRFFDAVSTHSYPRGNPQRCWNDASGWRHPDALCAIENVRAVMMSNGDAAKRIWLDELGWSTCSNAYLGCWRMGVSPKLQGTYIKRAYKLLERYPYVRAAFQYQFRDLYWGQASPDDWWQNLGLLRRDFSRKPAFAAYRSYARNYRKPDGPRLLAPRDGSTFDQKLLFRATASRPKAIRRVEFLIDGRVVARDRKAPYRATVKTSHLGLGAHTASARVVRRSGAKATTSSGVRRVVAAERRSRR